jgi:hypothetical protein
MESSVKLRGLIQSCHTLSLQLIRLVKYIEIIRKHGQWLSSSEKQFVSDISLQHEGMEAMLKQYSQIKDRLSVLLRAFSSKLRSFQYQQLQSMILPSDEEHNYDDKKGKVSSSMSIYIEYLEEQHKELACLMEQCKSIKLKADALIGSRQS